MIKVVILFWFFKKDQILKELKDIGYVMEYVGGPLKTMGLTRGLLPEENIEKANKIDGIIRPVKLDKKA